jgi:hypothetical protein
MKVYLMALGCDVWKSSFHWLHTPKIHQQMHLKRIQVKTIQSNGYHLEWLIRFKKVKVGQCTSAKEIWDKLQYIYTKESLLITMETNLVDQECEDNQKLDTEREENLKHMRKLILKEKLFVI